MRSSIAATWSAEARASSGSAPTSLAVPASMTVRRVSPIRVARASDVTEDQSTGVKAVAVPSAVASAIAAPGPIAKVVTLPANRLPSRPRCAPNRRLSAVVTYAAHPGTLAMPGPSRWSATSGSGMGGQAAVEARVAVPSSPAAAARSPAERASQPSIGQVLGLTERMLETPEAPSRSSAHRAGVRSAVTSDQVKPPVPIRMVRATTGVTAGVAAELGRGAAAIRAGVASNGTCAASGAADIRAGMRHRTASRRPSSAAARRVAGLTG